MTGVVLDLKPGGLRNCTGTPTPMSGSIILRARLA